MKQSNAAMLNQRLEFFLARSRVLLVNIGAVIFCFVCLIICVSLLYEEYDFKIVLWLLAFVSAESYALKNLIRLISHKKKPHLIVDEQGITKQFDDEVVTVLWSDSENFDIDFVNNGATGSLLIVANLKNNMPRFVINADNLTIKYEELFAILKRRLDAYNGVKFNYQVDNCS